MKIAFIVSLIFLSCAPKSVPVENTIMPKALPEATAKEPWQVEWEKTLALAKKEGSLVVSASGSVVIQEMLGRAFKDKYGIEVEWITGRTEQRSARMAAERRVGIYYNDVGLMGSNAPVATYKPWGILEPLPPNFILPEVKDQSAWLGGKWPFIDNEGMFVFGVTLYPQTPILYNTELARPEEFSSYKKLLDPKWKGKFISGDMTMVGGPQKWFIAMVEEDFGPILGLDYMRALAKQEPMIIRDDNLVAQWLMRGKYSFGLNTSLTAQLAEYRRQGIQVPLRDITPVEGGYVTVGGQSLCFFTNAPHPNASRIFINWVLSKEGAKLLTRASLKHSARIDMGDPREIEPEVMMRDPELKYVNPDSEKYLTGSKYDEHVKMAREIFGHLVR